MSSSFEFSLLGGVAVYPGHPITIAYCIVNRYSTFEDALAPTKYNHCHALGESDIPGAGGCVYSALDLLHSLRTGVCPVQALKTADEIWASCDDQQKRNPQRWQEGQDQADSLKEKFLTHYAWWKIQ